MNAATAMTASMAADAASTTVGATATFNIILNVIMSASMNQMLGSIKNLQVIVHLCLFTLIIPANADVFLAALFDMIAFDPIDVQFLLEAIFTIEEDTQEVQDALSDINENL